MAPISPRERYVALSCSNVGVGPGGTTSMLARVVIVDYKGETILDKYVAPTTPVSDYRTSATGITETHLLSSKFIFWNSHLLRQDSFNR